MTLTAPDQSPSPPATVLRGRWLTDWRPEDPDFWASTGRRVAQRNLWASIAVEHVGFSVWSLFSVFVLFMGPEYGVDAAGKFLLTSTATLVGSVLRVPYTFAVARFGGRNWTVLSGALLLIPTTVAAFVLQPGTPYWVFMLLAVLVGLGGGNFASSMANINTLYPEGRKGLALGLNAGGGNIGVAVVQLIGLLVIATAGAAYPKLLLAVYIPLIVVVSIYSALAMDNIADVRNDTGAAELALRDRDTYIMSFLYIGTFGSFIGYSFAFGLVLQNQFGRTPLQAAAVTFLGPLIGSLVRPVGGWLSDRIGGSVVTLWNFVAMAVCTLVCIVASGLDSLALFTVGFVGLFFFAGVGNGSTYKMIPAIYQRKAQLAMADGMPAARALADARRISGAAIGLISAVGALGGLLINLAFRESFGSTGSGTPAFWAFLVFYVVSVVVTYAVYTRTSRASELVTV
ncbi:MFS transporter, NNP family, nitrate/nitrite transporter [Pseudonocardia thermophila]|uniref:MFS transporter, NNP family, nitrate/nitrite transporter n=1 Tax=Pseudonocardia thermophila TaxID=1848 RepID=A0A1M6WBC6_PSETH|nr:nitrate/nitrite transporter [Pseudonocardia thermophila]SHK91072.1 MFS transporter, NNP family, nitrate/nitrite transporter [Pseudonocardia thermophila]